MYTRAYKGSTTLPPFETFADAGEDGRDDGGTVVHGHQRAPSTQRP